MTGVYKYDIPENGTPVFDTLIEANHIGKTEDLLKLSQEDIQQIRELSKDERITDRVCRFLSFSQTDQLDYPIDCALHLWK